MKKEVLEQMFKAAADTIDIKVNSLEEVNSITDKLMRKLTSLLNVVDIISEADAIAAIKSIVPAFNFSMTEDYHNLLKRKIMTYVINFTIINNTQLREKTTSFELWNRRDTLIDNLKNSLLNEIDNAYENQSPLIISEETIDNKFNNLAKSTAFNEGLNVVEYLFNPFTAGFNSNNN